MKPHRKLLSPLIVGPALTLCVARSRFSSDAGGQLMNVLVERLWRRDGLKVTMKQTKKVRLWLNDGSCIPQCPHSILTMSFHKAAFTNLQRTVLPFEHLA